MKTKSLYQLVHDHYELKYDAKSVTKYIVIIRNTQSVKTQEKFKLKLYIALSKLIMKSINNFFKLVRQVPEFKRLHDHEDIAAESYEVLDRCINNVEMGKIEKFYYYYNNSLNKAIYRLYQKNYVKHFGVVDNVDDQHTHLDKKGYTDHFDLLEVDLSSLTELEFDIIKAKLAEEKQKDIIKRLSITNEDFYNNYESAKQKIKSIYNYEPE